MQETVLGSILISHFLVHSMISFVKEVTIGCCNGFTGSLDFTMMSNEKATAR